MAKEQKSFSLNIYQRINAVMSEVQYLYKGKGAAKGLPYKFVSHDAVIGALHGPMTKHGIVMVPSVHDLKQEGNRTIATVEVTFVNIDEPTDKITVSYVGYGIDTQDKGPGKAISYAVKYALLKTFCLETGDDPERENIDYRPSLITEEQIQEIGFLVNGQQDLKDKILKHIPGQDLKNLTQDRFVGVVRWIENYQKDKTV